MELIDHVEDASEVIVLRWQGKPVFRATLDQFLGAVSTLDAEINVESENQFSLAAAGDSLDRVGQFVNVFRATSESDSDYLSRILTEIYVQRSSGTRADLERVIESTDIVDIDGIVDYGVAAFRLTVTLRGAHVEAELARVVDVARRAKAGAVAMHAWYLPSALPNIIRFDSTIGTVTPTPINLEDEVSYSGVGGTFAHVLT